MTKKKPKRTGNSLKMYDSKDPEIQEITGVSKATLYRAVRERKLKKGSEPKIDPLSNL
jgi:hypothetical protein